MLSHVTKTCCVMLEINVVKTTGTKFGNKCRAHVGRAPCGFYRPCEDGQVANNNKKTDIQTEKLLWLLINLWLTSVVSVGGSRGNMTMSNWANEKGKENNV